MTRVFGSSRGWIGFVDHLVEGTFQAVAGPETGYALSYTAWAAGEPNNGANGEDCVEFNGGAWNDFICGSATIGYFTEYDCPGVLIPGAYGCLCKSFAWSFSILVFFFIFFVYHFLIPTLLHHPTVPAFNGRFYDVLTGTTSHADAVSRAASTTYNGMTGYLATINSMEEYAFIHWTMRAGSVWLSGTDASIEGTWKYSSSSLIGSNVVYGAWGIGEPNGGTTENCLTHWAAGLADVSCVNNWITNFVVEFECPSPRIVVQGACIRMMCM